MSRFGLGYRPAIASAIIAVAWGWATLGSGGGSGLSTPEFLANVIGVLAALFVCLACFVGRVTAHGPTD